MPLAQEAAQTPSVVFSPIADGYDRAAQVLGLFQYRRWHRFLISRLRPLLRDRRGDRPLRILDMATGTGAIALDLATGRNVEVVGADVTRAMLVGAQARARSSVRELELIECTADSPPFIEESFDAITFAYLLRYVADVPSTLRGLSGLLRPHGMMAGLDFAVPRGAFYPLWRTYTDAVLPVAARLFSPDWRDVAVFLGPNIRDFYERWPERLLLDSWRDAGFGQVRHRRLSFGGAVVIWGAKE